MKKCIAFLLVFLLTLGTVPAMAEVPALEARIDRINEYGHAKLDITKADFTKAGFDLGDIVTVTCGSYSGDMPVFNGYYADRGETMLRVDPYEGDISLCVNYGNFSEMAGVGADDAVTIAMKEKGGALTTQEVNALVYSDDREDFASDAVFANFRPVAEGVLYRSASPIDNKANRAHYADSLIQEAGVQTVMNMANTPETIAAFIAAEDFASPYYRDLFEAGKVFALQMAIDFTSEAFAEGIVQGFSFLAEGSTPYLVHCLEGKDRTGFAIMVLEALMGWNEAQIVADYMQTYTNYYGIEPGTEKFDLIVKNNIMEMLCIMADLEPGSSLAEVNLKAAAESYLLGYGMDEESLKQLEAKLTSSSDEGVDDVRIEAENPFMSAAIEEALDGIAHEHGGPFGCVIVKDGEIVGRGHNMVLVNKDSTAHGEITAIRSTEKDLDTYDLSGCVLYTTGEPCPMCLYAILWANIDKVYYGCTIEDNAEIGFRDEKFDELAGGRDALSDYLACIDREACLELFNLYSTMEHSIY